MLFSTLKSCGVSLLLPGILCPTPRSAFIFLLAIQIREPQRIVG